MSLVFNETRKIAWCGVESMCGGGASKLSLLCSGIPIVLAECHQNLFHSETLHLTLQLLSQARFAFRLWRKT